MCSLLSALYSRQAPWRFYTNQWNNYIFKEKKENVCFSAPGARGFASSQATNNSEACRDILEQNTLASVTTLGLSWSSRFLQHVNDPKDK